MGPFLSPSPPPDATPLDQLRTAYAAWNRLSRALDEADEAAALAIHHQLRAVREQIRGARRRLGLPVLDDPGGGYPVPSPLAGP